MRLFILFLFISFNISAQKVYTLNECINEALSHNPEVLLQNLNIQKAQNSVVQVKNGRLPNLSTSASNGLNGGRSIDPFTNSFVQRTVSYNSFGLSGNVSLFSGFSLKNQILLNEVNASIESDQMELAKKELKFSVVESFMSVVANQQLVEMQEEIKKDILTQIESTKERIKEGVLPKYSQTEIEAQLANTQFELINAQNNLKLSKNQLRQLMMLKDDFEIKTPEKTEVMFYTPKEDLSYHPTLRISEKRITSAQYAVNVAKSEKLPKLSLNGGLGTSYSSAASDQFSYFRQLGHNFNQYVGLSLSVPIFSNVRPRIIAAQIDEKIAYTQKEKQRIQIYQQAEKLAFEINMLIEKLKSSVINRESQIILYEGAKEKYKEGLINNLELNTIQLNLEKATIQNIQTEAELYFKNEILRIFYE